MKRTRDAEEIVIYSSSEDDEDNKDSDDDYIEVSEDTDEEELYDDDEELEDEEDEDENARDNDEVDLDSSLSEYEDRDSEDEEYGTDKDFLSSDSEESLDRQTDRRQTFGVHGTKGAKLGQQRQKQKKSRQIKGTSDVRHKAASTQEDHKLFGEALSILRGKVLDKLKLEHCKVYLRHYSLRLTGSLSVLRDRVSEHFELKACGGFAKYPRSTFSVDCTGDACTGDVVLFTQRVKTCNHVASGSNTRPRMGKRIVAGRIVKESYGSDKQQHTFTVEVLWNKGPNRLPVFYPLLIKGRNLYRFKTYRQPWPNEGERESILQEKHSRGGVARKAREHRVSGKQYSSVRRTTVRKKGNTFALRREMKDVTRTKRMKSSKVILPGESNETKSHRTFIIKACYAGRFIGTKGRNIDSMERKSGALLRIHDHPSSSELRMVDIIGEPGQVQVASQMVVKDFSTRGFSPPVEST